MRVKEGNKEEDIIRAAINVFGEYGFYNSKIHKIADEAGIATGSIYRYFENKDDILIKIFELIWNDLYLNLNQIYKRADINSTEKFDYLIDIVFEKFSSNPKQAKLFVNEQSYLQNKNNYLPSQEKFLDIGEKIVAAGIKEKVFNKKIDVKILRYFLLGGIRYLLDQWANERNSFSISKLQKNVKIFIKNGILK